MQESQSQFSSFDIKVAFGGGISKAPCERAFFDLINYQLKSYMVQNA